MRSKTMRVTIANGAPDLRPAMNPPQRRAQVLLQQGALLKIFNARGRAGPRSETAAMVFCRPPRSLCAQHAADKSACATNFKIGTANAPLDCRASIAEVRKKTKQGAANMLYWSLVFLVIALVAALFGFSGIYVAAAGIAKILFVVFIILFLVGLVMGARRPPVL